MPLTALFGTKKDLKEQALVALAMLAVTAMYEGLSFQFTPGFSFNVYEAVGTWTGLVCVWLSRTRNILCWPWGILSAAALGYFFAQIGLPGQQWLNWIYFMIIQVWAWPHWAFGGTGKTELPVTILSWKGRVGMIAALIAGTALVYALIGYLVPGSFHPFLDALVVASSVVAQYLLGKKKVESWVLWLGPVNLVSIVLFFMAGAYTVGALYVAFFVHAIFALRSWNKSKQAHV